MSMQKRLAFLAQVDSQYRILIREFGFKKLKMAADGPFDRDIFKYSIEEAAESTE
jgi:hypothetical protein